MANDSSLPLVLVVQRLYNSVREFVLADINQLIGNTIVGGKVVGSQIGGSIPSGSIPTTGVTAGTYGNASNVGTFTVGSDGRLTAASNVAISGAGGGALTQIAQLISDGTGTYAKFTFSTISGSYTDLILQYEGRTTSTDQNLEIQINTDTAAHYDRQLLQANSTTAAASESISDTKILVGAITGTSVSAALPSSGQLIFPSYARTSFYKTVIVDSLYCGTDASAGFYRFAIAGWWRSTAAITQIDLYPDAGNWASGSIATLWGRT